MQLSRVADNKEELEWWVEGARPQGGVFLALKGQQERGGISTGSDQDTRTGLRAGSQAAFSTRSGWAPRPPRWGCTLRQALTLALAQSGHWGPSALPSRLL